VAQAQGWESPTGAVLLVSDDERERVVALLRQHWLAGRMSLEQLEGRMTEAWAAADDRTLLHSLRGLPVMVGAPVAPQAPQARSRDGNATAALVCGIVALTLLVLSFGLLSIISLPLSATAWGLGRSSRRAAQAAGVRDGSAVTAEALGIIGTVLGVVVLGGCAALVAASY
jgi:hypothetical protein